MGTGEDFYTGIVARLYGSLRSVAPDPEPYAAFVAACGEPALELGCGDGDPILELRSRGFDVEGLDSSADMLAGCRLPEPTPQDELGRPREHVADDGTVMRFTVLTEVRDDHARTQVSHVRYEVQSSTEDLAEDRSWRLHWWTQDGFASLADDAVSTSPPCSTHRAGRPAGPSDTTFAFWLTAPDA